MVSPLRVEAVVPCHAQHSTLFRCSTFSPMPPYASTSQLSNRLPTTHRDQSLPQSCLASRIFAYTSLRTVITSQEPSSQDPLVFNQNHKVQFKNIPLPPHPIYSPNRLAPMRARSLRQHLRAHTYSRGLVPMTLW